MDMKLILTIITIQSLYYNVKGDYTKPRSSPAMQAALPVEQSQHGKLSTSGLSKTRKALLKGGIFNKKKSEPESHSDEYYDDDYYHYRGEPLEEPYCPEDMFWHVRGFNCVPYDCPGGNQFRDKHTGECTLTWYGVRSNDWLGRQSRPLSGRGRSPTKFRLPFGLTLKG